MSYLSKKGMKNPWSAEKLRSELTRCLGAFDSVIKNTDETTKNQIVAGADNALEHRFTILGSNGEVLEPFVWNKDIKMYLRAK